RGRCDSDHARYVRNARPIHLNAPNKPAHRIDNSGGTAISLQRSLTSSVRTFRMPGFISKESGAEATNSTYLPDNSRLLQVRPPISTVTAGHAADHQRSTTPSRCCAASGRPAALKAL